MRPKLGSLVFKPHPTIQGFTQAVGEGFSIIRAETADACRLLLGNRYEVYDFDEGTSSRYENINQVRDALGPIT